MKITTLIALLKTYPKDADVFLCGLKDFFIYYTYDSSNKTPSILIDTDELDVDDIKTNKTTRVLQILNTIKINPSFEKHLLNADNLDDDIKMHKLILKALDDSDK